MITYRTHYRTISLNHAGAGTEERVGRENSNKSYEDNTPQESLNEKGD